MWVIWVIFEEAPLAKGPQIFNQRTLIEGNDISVPNKRCQKKHLVHTTHMHSAHPK